MPDLVDRVAFLVSELESPTAAQLNHTLALVERVVSDPKLLEEADRNREAARDAAHPFVPSCTLNLLEHRVQLLIRCGGDSKALNEARQALETIRSHGSSPRP
jgi:hypothetical protein